MATMSMDGKQYAASDSPFPILIAEEILLQQFPLLRAYNDIFL